MKFLHRNTPRLSGFSSKGNALTSPMTTLWLGIVFVAILFAIFTAKRSWTEAKEEEKSRMLHSGICPIHHCGGNWVIRRPIRTPCWNPHPT